MRRNPQEAALAGGGAAFCVGLIGAFGGVHLRNPRREKCPAGVNAVSQRPLQTPPTVPLALHNWLFRMTGELESVHFVSPRHCGVTDTCPPPPIPLNVDFTAKPNTKVPIPAGSSKEAITAAPIQACVAEHNAEGALSRPRTRPPPCAPFKARASERRRDS